jgi:hypothetical protein
MDFLAQNSAWVSPLDICSWISASFLSWVIGRSFENGPMQIC